MKARKYFLNKPWLSKGIFMSLRKKNTLYKRFLNKPDNQNRFKSYRNILTRSLRLAKRNYYEIEVKGV